MKRRILRILSSLLVVVMIVGSAPLSGFVGLDLPTLFTIKAEADEIIVDGFCGDNLTWWLSYSTEVLTIEGTGDMYNWTSYSDVPWYKYRSIIKTVVIGDSVTSIGNYAFYGCDNLKDIIVSNGVKSIGDYTFYNCTSLTNVYYTGTEEEWNKISIGSNNNKLTGAKIYYSFNANDWIYTGTCGDNLTWSLDTATGVFNISGTGDMQISSKAPWYNYRSSIKTVVIAGGVTSIGYGAFYNCTGLTSVTIPNSVTSIGESAFEWCTGLKSVTIPDSVTSIGVRAFKYCQGLISVTIGNSVKSIGDYAFEYCNGLTSVTIPDSVTSIGKYAFGDCDSLTSVTIGNNVTSIGDRAFSYCTSLTSVTIPDSVTSIGSSAFAYCDSLTSVTIPDSITSIGYAVFSSCTSLTSIRIPDSVTKIGKYAFSSCTSLISVTIGNSVIDIGEEAFDGCDSLSHITVDNNNQYYSSDSYGVLYNKDKTELIQYPIGNSRTSFTILNSVTSIGKSAFAYCDSLTSVTIGNSVTSIGYEAFFDCTGLTSITIPDSVTSIGVGAFEGCTSLTRVTIGDSVTSIGGSAFEGCTSLTSITVDSNNGYYSSDSYGVLYNKDKTKLIQYPIGDSRTSFTIPNTVTSIGGSAFYGCTSLTSVTIGNSVNSIGYEAFYGCTNLTSVIIGNNVKSIGKYAFYDCDSLTNITIPDSVSSIGDVAFYDCDSLTSVTIGNSVTNIGLGAFAGCNSVTRVIISNSVTCIEHSVFSGCYSLTDVYYTGTEEEWNKISIGIDNDYLLNATIHFSWVPGSCAHSSYTDYTTSATCGADGERYKLCNDCGEKFDVTVIPATGKHTYTSTVTAVATCRSTGAKKYTCTTCGYSYTETIAKDSTNHTGGTEIINAKSATCNADGYTGDTYCKGCSALLTAGTVIPSTGEHTYTSTVTSVATCNATGTKKYTCTACGYSYIETIAKDSTNHTGGTEIRNAKNATCGVDGYTGDTYCKGCSALITAGAVIPATGNHTYTSTITSVATCNTTGTKKYTCTVCGHSYTETIAKDSTNHTGGTEIKNAKNATCNADGYTGDTCCKGCSAVLKQGAKIPATGIHSNTSTVTVPANCTANGISYDVCADCGKVLSDTTIIPALGHEYGEWATVSAPNCLDDGVESRKCTRCNHEETRTVAALGHTAGEWEVVKEATADETGEKVRKCVRCALILETEIIPKLEVVIDADSGISVAYTPDAYESAPELVVEEINDGTVFTIINTEVGANRNVVCDISLTVNGVQTQPNGKVTVKIPIPEGYNPERTFIYHVNTETGKVENMNAVVEGDFLVFTTDHFSYYAIVEEYDIQNFAIPTPSTTTIKYGDRIILHAEFEGTLPDGARIEWTADNDCFSMSVSEDGTTCEISPKSSGKTTFTVTVYDADGNEIVSSSQEMTSKAGFFYKFIAFFKKLFGLLKVIPYTI